jgi:hypothetical protein
MLDHIPRVASHIDEARTGAKLHHSDQAVGINHIALWARSRKEVDPSNPKRSGRSSVNTPAARWPAGPTRHGVG